MSGHTEGCWTFNGFDVVSQFSDGHSAYIATPSTRGKSNWEVVANAHLIAAAPDLLAALDELLAELGNDLHRTSEGFNMARAAIIKARG